VGGSQCKTAFSLTIVQEFKTLRNATVLPSCHDSAVVRHGLEYRSQAVVLAGMNLHRSCGLGTLTANALIEPIDALNVGAVVTD
jgi:hypothetical protein